MRDSGQASLEYLGVVAVVVAVVAVLAAPALAGDRVAGGVVRQMERALCVVSLGDCEEDRRPCVVAADSTQDSGYVDLLVLHAGARELVLREARSDGRVAVTFLREGSTGLRIGLGDGGGVRVGRRMLRLGVEASARLLRLSGEGRTWLLAPADADALVRRLVVDGPGDLGERILHGGVDAGGLPAPRLTSTQRGLELALDAAAGRGGGQAAATLTADALAGSTVDEATGRRTFLVRRAGRLDGEVLLGRSLDASGAVDAGELVTVTVDAAGRPVDLGVLDAGEVSGGVGLPSAVARLVGASGGGPSGGRRWEVEQHLDLTVAANLAAARDFLAQATSPRPAVAGLATVGAALRARLDAAAIVDARTYAVDDGSSGVDVDGEAGPLRIGAGVERARRSARLLAASQRGLDGVWRARVDCVAPAA